MPYSLQNQTAIVTGGARGIGLGIVRRLVREGVRVVVWDLETPDLRTLCKEECPEQIDRIDVTKPEEVAGGIRRAAELLGHIDIFVNNAGINGPVKPVEDYSFDEWKKVLTVNLDSAFLCCRAVLPYMKGRGYGRIVNVSSISGKEGVPGIAAYATSKTGMIGFSKSLAREVINCGITVNCIAPVMTETDLLTQMTAEHIASSKAKIPMGRFLMIDEIASMVAFIASSECSFTTGFTFDLSGGRADY